jgi:hypothetical protein
MTSRERMMLVLNHREADIVPHAIGGAGCGINLIEACIDTQRILPAGTKKQIQEQVKRNVDILGKDGGFVFCPVHNVQNDVPIENFITMWETLMEVRNY